MRPIVLVAGRLHRKPASTRGSPAPARTDCRNENAAAHRGVLVFGDAGSRRSPRRRLSRRGRSWP
ncbi:hypothetical protein GLE_0255 [Lysobacter enzymogenes]|uniref:Uncharacterized protein n=1 Tax=Lysobacter enzymogenes TaxID=69 RepID=A0A0S2DAU4_LYSEN|nr:hypothetical protein GLE_0255 [Lysobacter enzymogenes]